MQIKNLFWYIVNKPLGNGASLAEKLSQKPFVPCGATQELSQGWVAPLSQGEWVYEAHGAQLMMLKQERRLLPASVVNEYLQTKVEQFEAQEGYPPSRKVRQQMKDDLTLELLPKAFTKQVRIPVLIFPKQGWLFVLTSSAKTADDVTAFLRDTIESLPVSLVTTDVSPSFTMTQWLSAPGELPSDWQLGEEVELRDAEDAVVKVRNQMLFSDEVQVHLDSGKHATKLVLIWQEQVSLLLQDDLAIKRIKVLNEEEAPADAMADEVSRFAHEFAVACQWIVPMCQSLIAALGGLDKALGASQARSHDQSGLVPA